MFTMPSFPALRLGLAVAAASLVPSMASAVDPAPPANTAPPAPTPSWTESVQFGGKAFIGWMMDLTEDANQANTFDITRAYIFAKAKLSDHINTKITIDAPNREFTVKATGAETTVSNGGGRFDVVLKHAYVEFTDAFTPGLSFKLGMMDLPWIPFEETMFPFRFLGPLMLDREGYASSADLGAGVAYELPAKWFSANLMVANGETWSKPEVSEHKDVLLRLTFSPYIGNAGALRITAFGSYGEYDDDADSLRLRLVGQLAWDSKFLSASVTYNLGRDRASAMASRQAGLAKVTGIAKMQGIGAWAWLDTGLFGVAEGLRILARFDLLDPDTDTDDNSHMREIVGIGYKVNSHFQVMATGEFTQNDSGAGAKKDDERRVFLNTEVSF